jgi:hypothetical protein
MRAIVLGVVVAAFLVVGMAAASSSPRLVLVSGDPVVVGGTGFRPSERVRLLVTPGPATRTVRAGKLGRFRTTLGLSIPRCGGVVVQALGDRGSRALIDRTGVDCTSID